MKLTRKIIADIRKLSNLPEEKFHQHIKAITKGFYKNWLKDAEHLIERGEPVRTDEEILLIDFYEAVKINRLKGEIDLAKGIESIDDPEGKEWLKKFRLSLNQDSKNSKNYQKNLIKFDPWIKLNPVST